MPVTVARCRIDLPRPLWRSSSPHWTVEDHLALMTDAGIDRALLSISSPGVYFGDAAAARQLARQVNQAAAQIKRAHPDRFGYFASLPLPDVDGALDEIDHSFADGADGVIWMTNAAGHYLGDPKVAPVLAELERRAAVVFLHPTSCAGHEALALGRPRPMVEFLFDTARTVIDFILSGAAHRYPQLRLIVPHAGGVLPLLTDRLELFRALAEDTHGPSVSEQLHRFYYDLAGTPTAPQITALSSISTPTHLLYGSDYVWTRHPQVLHALTTLDTSWTETDPAWRQLTTRNARQLLGITPNQTNNPT
ncbi:amidohydrolase family protein [Nocardia brasiliensis]|uniref:amidohydrolase family protein n=1 Tax=Nocardia brasiliensis TaxID=37326 RepID=UPI0023B1E5F7|nr:amidohydrolase family protein [Nocardia brasiliensis]